MYPNVVRYLETLDDREMAFAQEHLKTLREHRRLLSQLLRLVNRGWGNIIISLAHPDLGSKLPHETVWDFYTCERAARERLEKASLDTLRRIASKLGDSIDGEKKSHYLYCQKMDELEPKILTANLRQLYRIMDVGELGELEHEDIDQLRQMVLEKFRRATVYSQEQIYALCMKERAS